MEPEAELAATFLMHAKGSFAPPVDPSACEHLLARAWESSQAQWPTVKLPPKLFVKHLAERLPEANPAPPIEQLLEQLHVADLYLACACVHDIPSALEAFDRYCLANLPGLPGTSKQPGSMADDIRQLARESLLMRRPEGNLRLADYKGHGSLRSWVKVTATRIALKLQANEKLLPSSGPPPDSSTVAPGKSPEKAAIDDEAQASFNQALHEAVSELSADERHLFRLYYGHQLSMYEVAALFGVNQATISRWLDSARQKVYRQTRRILQERLDLSRRGFESFLNSLDSKLELSLSQLLGERDDDPSSEDS
jgi:RNA polymerase sigma-70 factor (ECF subfamily)